ncbi:MAG: T9SS type A sorting domain-containing protein [Ignavibacteria bacterium]
MKIKKIIITLLATFFISGLLYSQWLPTNGPVGGKVNSLAVITNNVICGTVSGVFYSTNNGGNWRFAADFYKNVYALLAKGNYLFAGTDTYGVFRSSDNGISWGPTSLNARSVISLTTNGTDIFAGCYTIVPSGTAGVWQTTNDGINWIHIGLGNDNIYSLLFYNGMLLAGTGSRGIFLTTNYGLNWIQTSIATNGVNTIINKDSFLFAGTSGSGVYISSNNGYSWGQTSLTNKSVYFLLVNQGIIYAGTDSAGIFISTNNGVTWDNLSNYIYGPVLSMVQKDNLIFVGTANNGVYISSNNGNSWLQTPLLNRWVTHLATNGARIFAGTESVGLCASSNGGLLWEQILPLSVSSLLTLNNYLFVGVIAGCCGSPTRFIMRSDDGGFNWVQIFPYDLLVSSLAYVGNTLLAGVAPSSYYDCGIYRSTDMGNTWTGPALDTAIINCLTVEGNNVFAGTDQGVFLSTDQGVTWQSLKLNNKFILSLAVKNNYIFAGTFSSGLYISSNFGQTWNQSSIINSNKVQSVLIIEDIVMTSVDYAGVYISTNFGQTWLLKNQGLDCKIISALLKDNNYVYAGTYTNSVWKRDLNDIISVKNISSITPIEFRLYQNYPNPFNAKTNIKFDLKEPGYIRIMVFDMLGRIVASLVEQQLNSGSYIIHWDATNIPSGIYYYCLSVDKYQSKTRKMILIK